MEPSRCGSGSWCKFEVVGDYPDAKVEVCSLCSRRVIYNKVNGDVDPKQYLNDHIRDFCQPLGRTRYIYEEIYGHEHAYKRRMEMTKDVPTDQDSIDEGAYEAKEALRLWKRLEGKGMTQKEIVQHLQASK